MVNHPISNMIVSIKNCQAVNKNTVVIGYSKIIESILMILKENGFIESISTSNEKNHKYLVIALTNKKILHMRVVSKPGNRKYCKSKLIPRPLRGQGLVILSTNKGIMSGKSASRQGLGGEIICEVY